LAIVTLNRLKDKLISKPDYNKTPDHIASGKGFQLAEKENKALAHPFN
jgi:hypothetical protein